VVNFDNIGPEKILEEYDYTNMKKERDKAGRFIKGFTPWNKECKGIYSNQTLERMSKAKKGKHISQRTEFKKGNISWCKGLKGLHIKGSEKGWFKKGRVLSPGINEKRLKNLREKILIKPNLEMNSDLAYALGILFGDGFVVKTKYSYDIVLDITNKNIALNFLKALRNIGLNPYISERMPVNGIGKLKKYIVKSHSLNFGLWFKSLSIDGLRDLLDDKEKIKNFVRGFYEAEGSICQSKNKYKIIQLSISNTNLELLKLIKDLSVEIDINFNLNGPYKNHGFNGGDSKLIYRLNTAAKAEVNKFMQLVNPSVKNLRDVNYGRI